MKTLIAYASTRGCTREAAELLQDHLDGAVMADLRKSPRPDLGAFDTVVVGGSIRMGRIQRQVTDFCRANIDALQKKRLGLYICCMAEGEDAEDEFETAYPEELRESAVAKGLFGGQFIFSKMNFIERIIVKKAAKVSEDVSTLNPAAIAEFAEKLSSQPD
ncbi:MAG: flavodoxin domain-containing protein [Bacillota bacterium]